MMTAPHTVIVILETLPGKEERLKLALQEVAEPSRQEKACIEYRLHQDKHHPTKFILYEKWRSQEEHALQFNKSYIVAFAEKAKGLLARPYEVYLANELD